MSDSLCFHSEPLSSEAYAAFGAGSHFIKQDDKLVLFMLFCVTGQSLLRQDLVCLSIDSSLGRAPAW